MKNRQITPVDKKALELAADDLTDRQRAFVDNLFTPGITQEDAAINAGYSARSASVAASRNLRIAKVLEYLDVCVNQGIRGMAIGASMVVKDLSDRAKSDYVKLQAAQDILNRSGHGLDDKAIVNVGELTVNIDLS